MKFKRRAREALLSVGQYLPGMAVRKLGNFVRDLELRGWMKANSLILDNPVVKREELFELIAAEVGDKPALYLEFGVAKGDATRFWSRILRNPESVLHGFDSFEGLPESWDPERPKGSFSTGGIIPQIDDPRVQFFKGMFEQTLSAYVPPNREVVILNLDADLYSSTILVLRKLRALVRLGTYIYFDEFSFFGHEERAFREFVEETGTKFKLRGGTPKLIEVLFQCTDGGFPPHGGPAAGAQAGKPAKG